MTYYQILKQRRIDLKLSIQDVAVQTRLAPEYIAAIEENDLDVFSDDYSFVRYFVHAYANAIGVNWEAISVEVDQTIKYHAHKKNMALTQAQRRIVENMPKAQASKRSRKKRSHFQSSISRASRSLHWSKRKLSPLALWGIVIVAGGFLLTNMVSSMLSANEAKARETARQAELQKKEQETQRLSQQRKEAKLEEAKTALTLSETADVPDTVYIQSDQAMPWTVQLNVSVPSETKIEVYKGEELVAGDADQAQTADFSTVLEIGSAETYRLVISSYKNNSITLNGQVVAYTPKEGGQDEPAQIELAFGQSAPVADESNGYGQWDASWYDGSTEDYAYGEEAADYGYGDPYGYGE